MSFGHWIRLALLLCASLTACGGSGPPRHAVLLVIDTLRADATAHAMTPHIDALAERGEVAEVAWSASTWTIPSIISLFTGSHVREHGWDHAGGFRALPEMQRRPTLASVLGDAGFATVGIYGNPIFQLRLGFDRGFDRFSYVEDSDIPAQVAEEVAGWDDGRRHFLYVHLMGPHEPLRPSAAAQERWGIEEGIGGKGLTIHWLREKRPPAAKQRTLELYRRAYWAAVEDTDERVGRILEVLEPHLDDAVLIFTSDHGEMLGERDRHGHSAWLDEPLTRVPFVGLHTGKLPPLVNGAAIPDLLTRALGVAQDWSVAADAPAPLISQRRGQLALSPDGLAKGVWTRNGSLRTFDLEEYPIERRGDGARRKELRSARAAFHVAVPAGDSKQPLVRPEAEMIEALRQLGYVDDADAPTAE